jgi:hypothetical protein
VCRVREVRGVFGIKILKLKGYPAIYGRVRKLKTSGALAQIRINYFPVYFG